MAITLDGTNGITSSGVITGPDGSASAPAITNDGDTNTGIFFPAADTIAFGEGGAEVMRIDSSGNVGIGTTSPGSKLDTAGSVRIRGNSSNDTFTGPGELAIKNSTGSSYISWHGNTGTRIGYIQVRDSNTTLIFNEVAQPMTFGTDSTERGRFTAGGYFKASTSGTYLNATGTYHEIRTALGDSTLEITNTSATTPYGTEIFWSGASPNNTTQWFLQCADSTNSKLIIYSSGTVTNRTGTYNSFSDIKLKQDITDASSQWNDIKALRIVKYRLKDEVAADPNYPAYIGVIAQEVEQVSPGLIDNCVDKDSGEVTKSVKSSIIYMKAVKALQEAMERIETLEAQNAAFEARLAALEAQ
jgi:hypothetical protein